MAPNASQIFRLNRHPDGSRQETNENDDSNGKIPASQFF